VESVSRVRNPVMNLREMSEHGLHHEKWVRNFLKPMAKDLGPTPVPGEPAERQGLRADVFAVLTRAGRIRNWCNRHASRRRST